MHLSYRANDLAKHYIVSVPYELPVCTLLLAEFYQVIFEKLFTNGAPHLLLMVHSVEPNVIIVHLQQSIRCSRVITQNKLWKSAQGDSL